MRYAALALSTVLLSGCSWFGGYGHGGQGQHAGANAYYGGYGVKPQNPCQVVSRAQPVPRGCNPSQVTIATQQHYAGGFQQQPDFTTGSYGSHVNEAENVWGGYIRPGHKRKPLLRGSLSVGFEKSNGGNILDYSKFPDADPTALYTQASFNDDRVTGTPADGSVTTESYSVLFDDVETPSISYDDVHSTPFRVAGGLEYILSPNFTTFANAGYTRSEGNSGTAARGNGTIVQTITTQAYDTTTLAPSGAPVISTAFDQNRTPVVYDFNFNDMERVDLEIGGRYYFEPLSVDENNRTITPFVGASGGVAHYNKTSFEVTQRQLDYAAEFNAGPSTTSDTNEYYTVSPDPVSRHDLYDSQWVPQGALTAGVEWQVTPKWGLAVETGVKYEGARDYANGVKGDENIAIPVTLRGSFNF